MLNLIKIRQSFSHTGSAIDPSRVLADQLPVLSDVIKPGMNIAIAVGSRGIADLVEIVTGLAEYIRTRNAQPFIIPAMGSHGGATAEGQQAVLHSYGLKEELTGAPVRPGMETVELGTKAGARVFMDAIAHDSDGIILVNRIKPHTDFHSRYESGLVKMSVIGLGNHDQAMEIHRMGLAGLVEVVPQEAETVLNSGKILGGVAIVENAYDQVAELRVLPAGEIMLVEPKLLEIARMNMAALPVEDIDVLFIDQIGKDISGTGLDPNIIGRIGIPGQPDPDKPSIRSIVLNDVSEASHGNALGTGLADVITRKLFDKIDFKATYQNIYTSSFLERAKIPVIAENAAEAMRYALRNQGAIAADVARVVRISDTLHLSECYVSESIWLQLKSGSGIEQLAAPVPLTDSTGALNPF